MRPPRAREQLGRRLAADLATRADARDALGELARAAQPVRPYTVAVSPSGFLARVPPGGAPPAPWTEVAPGRWRRPRDPRPPGPSDVQLPRLVRVGVDKDDAQVLVDLTYLDGVLAVTGDAEVARDLVVLLVEELLAAGEAVTVVDPDGRLGDHPGARRAARLGELPAQHRRAAAQVTAHPVVAAAAQPRPDAHIAVLTDVPSERDAAALGGLVHSRARLGRGRVHRPSRGALAVDDRRRRLRRPRCARAPGDRARTRWWDAPEQSRSEVNR